MTCLTINQYISPLIFSAIFYASNGKVKISYIDSLGISKLWYFPTKPVASHRSVDAVDAVDAVALL